MLYYMRDHFFKEIHTRMRSDKNIFFLTADVGSPVLDSIKDDFSERFINVGIAEQNMINVAAGLAMEGLEVYAYSIASFFLRCVDQVRNSLLLSNQMNKINVNLLATGKGISYETAGPAHHSLEDLAILNVLPGMEIFVPSDSVMAKEMAQEVPAHKGVKYFCFEGKKSPNFYDENYKFKFSDGFTEYNKGKELCLISQGSILSLGLEVADKFKNIGINAGIIDVFASSRSINREKLIKAISGYKKLLVIEEGYRHKGLLINTVRELTFNISSNTEIHSFGFDDKYIFEVGPREMHYKNYGLSVDNIIKSAKSEKSNY